MKSLSSGATLNASDPQAHTCCATTAGFQAHASSAKMGSRSAASSKYKDAAAHPRFLRSLAKASPQSLGVSAVAHLLCHHLIARLRRSCEPPALALANVYVKKSHPCMFRLGLLGASGMLPAIQTSGGMSSALLLKAEASGSFLSAKNPSSLPHLGLCESHDSTLEDTTCIYIMGTRLGNTWHKIRSLRQGHVIEVRRRLWSSSCQSLLTPTGATP